jgi:hypothetical protein
MPSTSPVEADEQTELGLVLDFAFDFGAHGELSAKTSHGFAWSA